MDSNLLCPELLPRRRLASPDGGRQLTSCGTPRFVLPMLTQCGVSQVDETVVDRLAAR
jgi:hypothetical protein